MKNLKQSILVISLGLALAACGGGGGDSGPSNTGSNTGSNSGSNTGSNNGSNTGSNNESTGSVLEMLDTSKTYKIIYSFPSSDGMSTVNNVKQNTNGIITEFGSYILSGTLVGKEIAGNKNYTLARIAKGQIDYSHNGKTETTDVSKYVNGSYYYFAYNPLQTKLVSPQAKQVNCTDINYTQAKLTNGKGNAYFVSPTIHNGSITLNTDGSIGVAFTAKVASDETSFVSSLRWVDQFNSYNTYNLLGIANEQGQSNQIGSFGVGENGSNSIVVGSIYNIKLSNGANYNGSMSMVCSY